MPIEIIEDLVKGCRFTVDEEGETFIRIFRVLGLNPSIAGPLSVPAANLAIDSNTGATIPRYGMFYPGSLLCVNKIESRPFRDESLWGAEVTLTYGPPQKNLLQAWQVEISGSGGSKQMERWGANPPAGAVKNDPILIPYNPNGGTFNGPIAAAGLNVNPAKNGGIYYDYASIPILSPNTILRFTRILQLSNPLNMVLAFKRKFNGAAFQGQAAKLWLCRDATASGSSVITGQTAYRMSFLFEFDPDGWDRIEYFRSEINGKLPAGISPGNASYGNGFIAIQPYTAGDFNSAGFPNVY